MNVTFQQRYVSQTQYGIRGLECYSPRFCWAFGPSHLLRSEDGGRSWKDSYWASPLHVGMNPQHVAFFSADQGLLLVKKGSPELIYFRSHDGGQSWKQMRRLSEGGYVWTRLCAVRRSAKAWTLIKRGDAKAFVEKFDAKRDNWTRTSIAIPGYPYQIMFVNESRGWILERWDKKTWIEPADVSCASARLAAKGCTDRHVPYESWPSNAGATDFISKDYLTELALAIRRIAAERDQ